MPSHFYYYRISITGDPGSGKSTFARAVTQMTGYHLITTGNIFRELAAQKNISVTELNELAEKKEEIDRQVDDYLVSLNEYRGHLVLDSRMAWFFVRNSLKIRLTVNPEIAARRIFKDTAELREKFSDESTAVEEVERRKKSEVFRYKSLYGVDISDTSNFDLIIDTSAKAPEDVTRKFEAAFEKYKSELENR